jgi:hypothetical protein
VAAPLTGIPLRHVKSFASLGAGLLSVFAAILPLSAFAYDLPDPKLTPGAINEMVTQANIRGTICRKGWTRTIRPPVSYTNRLKHQLMRKYGVGDGNMRDFELDHLIPLELGGAPDDPANLWPQPRTGTWNADLKDDLERTVNRRVCEGRVSLAEAQKAIRTDWIAAYKKYESARAKANRAER